MFFKVNELNSKLKSGLIEIMGSLSKIWWLLELQE